MHKIELQPRAEKDCDYWQKHNPKLLEKTDRLLKATNVEDIIKNLKDHQTSSNNL